MPLTEVAAVAGHSSGVVTAGYVHRDESTLRAGMARLEADLVSRWYQTDEENKNSQASKGFRRVVHEQSVVGPRFAR